ncbi:hypothetical protein M413DRAFT_198594 [Hebeloma cylindrosporum]|uniref:F-box domain-containing protein n=1 Tax=Hebeloma cylindrosporum TaxID=76867 RepID=A0A0C2XNZ0_HEBCY|nr:hypothetical protein M413DRAFT_198594 [Hebeloma cylindrosporum h7]
MIGFVNPILHPRLRSLDLLTVYPENFLDVINLPSLEEWSMDMGFGSAVAAMQSFLTRSGCHLRVLNLDRLGYSSKNIESLLEQIPTLERLRLSSMWKYGDGDVPYDILTRIFWAVPSSRNIRRGNPTHEPFLPRLQVVECTTDESFLSFSWDDIPRLYSRGHRRSVTLKAFATHSDMTDETALRLLRLTEEGVDLEIGDLTESGDFLQNFRKRMCVEGV